MPDWFPSFVKKFITKNADRAEKIDQDITKITDPDLPDVEVLKYDDGRIEIVENIGKYFRYIMQDSLAPAQSLCASRFSFPQSYDYGKAKSRYFGFPGRGDRADNL